MKNIFKTLFCLAAVSTALISCNESYEPYEVGEDEVAGCYGVYFPAQEAAGSHTLDPTQDPSATFTVKRTNTDGAITVPIVATYSEDGIFTISPVQFENGQSETTFTVSFPNAVEGTTYEASFEIQDPQYASKYNNNPIAIDYSVMRVSWSTVEDPTATGSSSTVTFNEGWWGETHKVHIKYYEVNGVRHCQVDGTEACDLVYSDGSTCAGGMWGNGNNFEFTWDTATNKINVPKQVMFTHSSYGYVYVYGWDEFFISDGGYSAASLGDATNFYTNNGASYPQSYYDGNGGFYFNLRYYVPGVGGWTPDQFDVVGIAEGFTRVDYSMEISAGETVEGVMPIYFDALGADVAKVKYVAYEGTLSATQINNKVSGISAGTEENISEYVVEEGATGFGVTLDKSGVYTLVAVACDETGAAQNSASVEFCYVAKGDSIPVEISCGIAATDKYTPEGYTSENSLEYYIYGKDIKDVKVAVFSKMDMADYDSCIGKLKSSKSVSSAVVAEINDKGTVDIATKLSPGTTYYLLVWASNGYESTIVYANATTNGDPLPVYMNYSYTSYAEEFAPANEAALYGTYNLYAVDAYGDLGMREYVGKAVIADSATPNEGPDDDGYYDEFITIKGLGGPVCEKAGVDDTYEFDLYGGAFYNLGKTTVDGKTQVYVLALADGKTYTGSVTYGIPVGDGYYAIVSTARYADSYNFGGYCFYNPDVDPDYYLSAYYDYLFVDPAKDNNGLAPKDVQAKVVNAKRTLQRATDMGMSPKEAIDAVLMNTPVFNCYIPAGIKAEWEGVSVPAKTVSVDFSNVQKSDRNMEISKEHISLR